MMSFEVWITLATSIGFALGFYANVMIVNDKRRYDGDMARNDVALVRARLANGRRS